MLISVQQKFFFIRTQTVRLYRKAARKMLLKLITEVNFVNILRATFVLISVCQKNYKPILSAHIE